MRNHPARHNGVKSQDQGGCYHPDQAGNGTGDAAFIARCDTAQGLYSIGMGVATDYQFRHQRRVGQGKGKKQVNQ